MLQLKKMVTDQETKQNNLVQSADINPRNHIMNKPGVKKNDLFVNAFEVAQDPVNENTFLIANVLPRSVIGCLTGSSDVGKSIFCRNLTLAIAQKKETFIGQQLNCIHGRVIYLSSEDAREDWAQKFQTMQLEGTSLEALKNIEIVFETENINPKVLSLRLQQSPVDLIVVDVFSDFFQGDLNDAIQVRRFMDHYKRLVREFGVTVLFVHHINKKGERQKPNKTNVLGSSAIEASMRCVLQIQSDSENDNERHLFITKGNYLPPSAKKRSHKFRINTKLQLETVGEGVEAGFFINARQPISEEARQLVVEMQKDGLSSRKIAEKMNKHGMKIGKTTVNEIMRSCQNSQVAISQDIPETLVMSEN